MTFLSTLWAAVLLATGGLSLLPHDLKPRSPIEQRGAFRSMPPPPITVGSGYKPSTVPSDSAWAAEPPDTAWSAQGDEWYRAQARYDSINAYVDPADSLRATQRADSIRAGLVDPSTFTWEEWQYQRARAMWFYQHHNRKVLRKQHLKELNGKTDVPSNWAQRN